MVVVVSKTTSKDALLHEGGEQLALFSLKDMYHVVYRNSPVLSECVLRKRGGAFPPDGLRLSCFSFAIALAGLGCSGGCLARAHEVSRQSMWAAVI